MESCLYTGWVTHQRFGPIVNRFRYRLFLVALNLDRLEQDLGVGRFWSVRPSIAWFRRADHFGPVDVPLSDYVRQLLQQHQRPCAHQIFIVTNLRYWGWVFNPVSFYLCLDRDGQLETLVAEVTNTPWNQTHTYVVAAEDCQGRTPERCRGTRKQFHVSPFMPMQQHYFWKVRLADEQLDLQIESVDNATLDAILSSDHSPRQKASENGLQIADQSSILRQRCFQASLQLKRKPLNGWNRLSSLVSYPFQTVWIMVLIYWQALILWLKGVRFHPHPGRLGSSEQEAVKDLPTGAEQKDPETAAKEMGEPMFETTQGASGT